MNRLQHDPEFVARGDLYATVANLENILDHWQDRVAFYNDPDYLKKDVVLSEIETLKRSIKRLKLNIGY